MSLDWPLPLRVVGGSRSGKTAMLRRLAEQCEQPLVVCATEAAAARFGHEGTTTFWRLAAEIVGRHDQPVRILSSAEQQARVGDPHLANAVCHYEASFLGREELRTHADAAGVYDQWEQVADAAEDYLPPHEADWASVLVRASMLLRDEAVLAAERQRFTHVLVDDFEAASFAANRLLTQLAGFGGPLVVAGNPGNRVWRHVAGSPRHLDRFQRRFGAQSELSLTEAHGTDAAFAAAGEATLVVGPGGDPWLPNPEGPLPVALSTGLAWQHVALVVPEGEPDDGPYDLDVLAGPDVPDEAQRAERRRREHAARLDLARSRAPSYTAVQPPST